MKKCFLLLSLFVVSLFANQCFAQINDPLNQSKKVNEGWSSQPEQVISKKKNNVSENKDKDENKGKSEIINSQKKIKITNR